MTWPADDLAALLATVRRPGDFFASGSAELLAPLLEVEGVGVVALPLLYTPAELGFAALKGADAAVAGVLGAAARDAGCDLHLALLTVEESGAAEYVDTYPRRRRWGDEEDEFEAGEVFDRSMT